MIEPYLNAGLAADADNAAVFLASCGLTGVNVAVQIIVLIEGVRLTFETTTDRDVYVFVFNTVLIGLATGYQLAYVCTNGSFTMSLNEVDHSSLLIESGGIKTEKKLVAPSLFFTQYIINELSICILPVAAVQSVLYFIFYFKWGTPKLRRLLAQFVLRKPLEEQERITVRDAELALRLQEFLPSLEYTWFIVYPPAAFAPLSMVNDESVTISFWLLMFSIFFYLYQRYVNLCTLAPVTYNSVRLFNVVLIFWGLVVSSPAAGAVWWCWRLDYFIQLEWLGPILTVMAYLNAFSLYILGLHLLGLFNKSLDDDISADEVDTFDEDDEYRDPGYEKVMERCGYSWWTKNPIYVLKSRYCPDADSKYECHKDVACWPSTFELEGICSWSGTSFRNIPNFLSVEFTVACSELARTCSHWEDRLKTMIKEKIADAYKMAPRRNPKEREEEHHGLILSNKGYSKSEDRGVSMLQVEVELVQAEDAMMMIPEDCEGFFNFNIVVKPAAPPRGDCASVIFYSWQSDDMQLLRDELNKAIEDFMPDEQIENLKIMMGSGRKTNRPSFPSF